MRDRGAVSFPRRWALVPLRVVIGIGFVVHGYAKLARGPSHFAAIVAALDLPAPLALAWATTLVEIAGGVALLAGAFVAPVAVALGAVMVTAIVGVHLPYGFSSVRLVELTDAGARFGPVGYELPLVYVVALIALALAEPSPGSIDAWRARRR
jgi:putative oxidoreductase